MDLLWTYRGRAAGVMRNTGASVATVNQRVRRLRGWATAVVLAANAVVWNLIAAPYRLFPSDDHAFLPASPTRAALHLRQPVLTLWVDFWNLLTSAISAVPTTPLLWQGIAANDVSALVCGVVVTWLSRSSFWGYVGAAIFALSCWPATYLFMASYASFGSLVSLVLFTLIFRGYLRWSEGRRSAVAGVWHSPSFFIMSAGGVGAVLILTSPGAPIMLAVAIIGVAYLFRGPWLNCLGWLGLFSAPVFIGVIGILVFNHQAFSAILQHVSENIHSVHYGEARIRFGHIPKPPFGTMFFILRTYSPSVLVLLISVLLAWIAARVLRLVRSVEARAIDVVFIMAIAHALLIDIAPTTKLARSHFAAYPLLVIGAAAATGILTRCVKNRRWVSALAGAVLILAVIGAYENMSLVAQLRSAKQSAFDAIERLGAGDVYFVGTEAERAALDLALQSRPLREKRAERTAGKSLLPMRAEDLATIVSRTEEPGRLHVHAGKISVIIGPHGPWSGRSIRQQCTLPDTPEVRTRVPEDMQAIRLPYYTYLPAFLLEEEICQALYFRGEVPDFRRQDLGLTLWVTRP